MFILFIFFAFIVLILAILSVLDSAARFTHVPPSKLYVVKGGTARFEWDYHVDDRSKEFDSFSPQWIFYDVKYTSTR